MSYITFPYGFFVVVVLTERVIGVLKGRFHILDGPLPRCLVQSARDKNQGQATVDKLVNVCAALVNMAQSIIK